MKVTFFPALLGIVLAIDSKNKALIRAIFDELNSLWKSTNQGFIPHENFDFAYENLAERHVFLEQTPESTTFSIAVPENGPGGDLANVLALEILELHQTYVSESGAFLLQNVLRKALMRDCSWDSQASVIYATRYNQKLQILNVGLLWVGLYRKGKLINSSNSLGDESINSFGQSGRLIEKITESPGADFTKNEQIWDVQSGDMLIATWADLQIYLGEIVDLAMASADASDIPASQILASLKPFFEIERIRENALVVIKLD